MATPYPPKPTQLALELPAAYEPPAPVILIAAKKDSSTVSTHYLLSIAHRMLADNSPDLQSVAIIREGFASQGRSLKVILSREKNNKITETWGWAE